jgi:hypothetical protein
MEQNGSGLWTPGSDNHPMGAGATPSRSPSGDGAIDVYPSEQNELMILMGAVMKKYEAQYATEDVQARMSMEIQDRVRENLNLLCSIEWLPTDINYIDGEYRATLTPTVTVTGRVSQEEIDHERVALEVQAGELDGIAGKIDEHGNFKTN